MNRTVTIAASVVVIIVVVAAVAFQFSGQKNDDQDALFQVSTFEALQNGRMQGVMTVGDLMGHGNTGLGTFDGLDGEMTVIDGVCYQITSDGKVHVSNSTYTTPFADIVYFHEDRKIEVAGSSNFTELENALQAKFTDRNIFYMIKVHATFDSITVRSVPKQSQPYPPLADVVANQSKYTYIGVEGTLVGMWSPSFIGGINYAGFHFHFISDDRTMGGHVLDLRTENITAQLDLVHDLQLSLAAS